MKVINANPQSGIQGLKLDTVTVSAVDLPASPDIRVEVNGNLHLNWIYWPSTNIMNIVRLNLNMEDKFYINFYYDG